MPTDPLPAWVLVRRQKIGEQVRTARLARQLTQEKLGELVDLDRKTINRIEQGSHATLVDHLIVVADALGLEVQFAERAR